MSKFNKLTPSDFETRDIEILNLDTKRWSKVAEDYVNAKHQNVMQVKELGTILLLPLPVERLSGFTLVVTAMLLHAINDIRLSSAYFKLQQVRPDFGNVVAKMLQDDSGHHADIAGHKFHWKVVQRHFSKPSQPHPEVFDPHVTADDLNWRKVEETLYRLEPALHFWYNMDYVAARGADNRPISFNLLDMSVNYLNQLPYEGRFSGHFKSALHNELYGRYMVQPHIESQVLKQFDNSAMGSELIAKVLRVGVQA